MLCLMKINNKEIKSLVKSFAYAFRGLWFCVKNERNMRIHIVAAVVVLLFSLIYGLTRTEYALLVMMLGLVMVCELVNTAIEALVNLGAPAYDSLARIAKDVAAAAVLLCALAAVGVGLALFWHPAKLWDTLVVIITTPVYWISFLILLILGVLFIFRGVSSVKTKIPTLHKIHEGVKIYHPKKSRLNTIIDENSDVKIYRAPHERQDSKNSND